MKKFSLSICLTLGLLLAGCGGGGGGGGGSATPAPEPAPVTPPPVEPTPSGFNISGAVNVSANLSVDGDTNNPDGSLTPNNSISTAQPISNPSTLGGYVSQVEEGETGLVQAEGDIDDYFRVELLAGQSVTLLVADFEQADADLYLYNTNGDIVDFSIETGQIESLFIPQDGTYLINVFAFAGATNYVLAIGTNNSSAVSSGNNYPNIIPWQAIVVSDESEQSLSSAAAQEKIERRMAVRRKAGGKKNARGRFVGARNRPLLMSMANSGLTEQQRQARLGRAKGKNLRSSDPALYARWETLMTIKALNREPGIVSAEPNYRVHALADPNDEAFNLQWHYPLINLPAAWDLTTGDPQVIVAVIDTGMLQSHPDMAGQLVPGYDFIADAQTARDNDGIDPNPEDEGDGSELGNSSFHGTHVGGTIAAATDNGIGVAGVAWNARLMPVRVLGVDGGTTYDVGQGVRYAAGLANDSGTVPEQPADVINLSLGGGGFSQSSQAIYDEVRQAGVIVVAAAGNEGSGSPSYPAAYDGVISVSAVDIQRRATPYTNFGSTVDVAAPGGDNGLDFNGDGYPDGVLSTGGSASDSGAINFVYSFLNGTSMASPHVAGVMALMKSVNPALSPADIDTLLSQGQLTEDLGEPGRDDLFGHGLINAQRAVVAALNAAGNPPADNPQLSSSSNLLNFGSAAQTLDLVLQNSGNGDLAITEIITSGDWLSLVALDTDETGLGSYRVSVERDGLAPGIYSAKIVATSTINTVTIEVLVAVVGEATGGDVGIVYILLVDSLTQDLAAQFNARSINGLYGYRFENIPAGSYELFAGTDADNDLFVCDAGEACGAYLTVDQPVQIEVNSNLENLEFPVEYRVAIPTLNSASEQSPAEPGKGLVRKRD